MASESTSSASDPTSTCTYQEVGHKFRTWLDVIFLQLPL